MIRDGTRRLKVPLYNGENIPRNRGNYPADIIANQCSTPDGIGLSIDSNNSTTTDTEQRGRLAIVVVRIFGCYACKRHEQWIIESLSIKVNTAFKGHASNVSRICRPHKAKPRHQDWNSSCASNMIFPAGSAFPKIHQQFFAFVTVGTVACFHQNQNGKLVVSGPHQVSTL
ncbi:hypothetical protein Pden_3006 [Paracoccus denitrificans PD1222]|uniref:Uncharacterized protein n=1 Tax=Paracoccus denitrificans (strain Pd 1222) TaxID=318586 RepID=A1B6E5_PARDP|nr:hypothetical protein Pden_3006 [Paracoccus denitrificans PD1222]